MAGNAFIIGGAGQIGSAVAKSLCESGWQMTLGSRGNRPIPVELLRMGAKAVVLDRAEPRSLGLALGAGTDVVIDVVAFDASHADQLVAVQSSVGSFVAISSVSVYRDAQGRTLSEADKEDQFPDMPIPIMEMQPTVEPGDSTYSTRKIALERRLLDRVTQPVTILRPGAIYGPHSGHPREWWFVKRLLDGRSQIPLAFNGQSQFHTSSAANIAALVSAVARRPTTQILNAVDSSAPTVSEIGHAVMSALGMRAVLVPAIHPSDSLNVGMTPWSTPKPFVVSDAAARETGYKPVAEYAEGVIETCHWLASATNGQNWKAVFPVFAGYSVDPFD
jgi:nucleoside-diphosphate-sugar epimerase